VSADLAQRPSASVSIRDTKKLATDATCGVAAAGYEPLEAADVDAATCS